MKSTKGLLIFAVLLFGLIGTVSLFKKNRTSPEPYDPAPVEITLEGSNAPTPQVASNQPVASFNQGYTNRWDEGDLCVCVVYNYCTIDENDDVADSERFKEW